MIDQAWLTGTWIKIESQYVKGSHKSLMGDSSLHIKFDLSKLTLAKFPSGKGWIGVFLRPQKLKDEVAGQPPCIRYIKDDQPVIDPCVGLAAFDLQEVGNLVTTLDLRGNLRREYGTNNELQFMLKKQGSSQLKTPNTFLIQVKVGNGPPMFGPGKNLMSQPVLEVQSVRVNVVTIQKVQSGKRGSPLTSTPGRGRSPSPSPKLTDSSPRIGCVSQLSSPQGLNGKVGPETATSGSLKRERPSGGVTFCVQPKSGDPKKAKLDGSPETAAAGPVLVQAADGDTPEDVAWRICKALGCEMSSPLLWGEPHPPRPPTRLD